MGDTTSYVEDGVDKVASCLGARAAIGLCEGSTSLYATNGKGVRPSPARRAGTRPCPRVR